MLSTSQIKKEARDRFAVNRYQAMLAYSIVYMIVIGLAMTATLLSIAAQQLKPIYSIVLGWYGIVVLFVFFIMLAPFQYSMAGFYLKSYRAQKADVSSMLDGFNRYNMERGIVLHILRALLMLAFTILLIVPGVIFAIRTSMSVYILRANPKIKPMEALKASNKIMKGHSGAYFVLNLSFIGWYLFGLLTLFTGFIWVVPYVNTSKVVFYKRNIQGDTSVYGQDTEDGESEDEDENNIAVKLMKVQLENEIKQLDTHLETVSKDKKKTGAAVKSVTAEPISAEAVKAVTAEPVTALDNFEKSERTDDRSFDEQINDVNDLIEGVEPVFVREKEPAAELTEEEARAHKRENERKARLERIKLEREKFKPSERPRPTLTREKTVSPEPETEPVKREKAPPAPKAEPVREDPAAQPKKPLTSVTIDDDFDDLFKPEKIDVEIEE